MLIFNKDTKAILLDKVVLHNKLLWRKLIDAIPLANLASKWIMLKTFEIHEHSICNLNVSITSQVHWSPVRMVWVPTMNSSGSVSTVESLSYVHDWSPIVKQATSLKVTRETEGINENRKWHTRFHPDNQSVGVWGSSTRLQLDGIARVGSTLP